MSVRFVVFGDTKGKEQGINRRVLESILTQVKRLEREPDFFAVLGDTIAGSSDLNIHRQQMMDFKLLMNKYFPGKLFLPVVGNHEVDNFPQDDTYERLIKEYYLNFRQQGSLKSFNDTAYYMELPHCRYVVLNCFHFGEIRKIENQQLEWFEKASSAQKKFKILFVHCPPFPTGAHVGTCLDEFFEKRDEFWRVVEKNKFDIVFSGHEHNYSRRVIQGLSGDIQQIVSGGGGEKLRKGFKSKEGVVVPPKAIYHFVVVDMDEDSLHLRAVDLNGKVIDEFTITK